MGSDRAISQSLLRQAQLFQSFQSRLWLDAHGIAFSLPVQRLRRPFIYADSRLAVSLRPKTVQSASKSETGQAGADNDDAFACEVMFLGNRCRHGEYLTRKGYYADEREVRWTSCNTMLELFLTIVRISANFVYIRDRYFSAIVSPRPEPQSRIRILPWIDYIRDASYIRCSNATEHVILRLTFEFIYVFYLSNRDYNPQHKYPC
jgi:hypothetical protein